MDLGWTVFIIVLFVNAVAALFLAFLLYRKPVTSGRNAMIWMLILLAIWAFCYAMITVSPSMDAKIFWLKLENIGILTAPVFWFFFTLQYTQMDKRLNRFTGTLFFIIPVASLALLFNPSWFHLYYTSAQPAVDGMSPLIITRGTWYYGGLVQSYVLNLTGMGLLIWRFIQYRDLFRRQAIVLVGAVLVPLLVNVFYQIVPRLVPGFSIAFDLTPVSFTFTAGFLSITIFGLRLFDLVPIARHIVLEHIPEMVFVIDAQDRVLDANSVAQETLGKSLDEMVGGEVIDVFRVWPELINRFLTSHEAQGEIQIPGDPPRVLEIMVSALYNRFKQLEGRVIVAHDVTDRKWLENDLKYANETLEKQLEDIRQLRAELEEQAIRDPLTNVYNRRFLADAMDRELAQAGREDKPASVVILDIDFFKQFNDTYGHRCGDYVLQYMAEYLGKQIRRGDVLCRYGGEEFVIFMPHAPIEAAYQRAETWRSDIANAFIDYEGLHLKTSFSAGVAGFPMHGSASDGILNAADRALYQAKNTGRNRVVMYDASNFKKEDLQNKPNVHQE